MVYETENPQVYLSPSVQDWNIGYGDYGTEEIRANLIADVVEQELIRNGIRVVRNSPDMTLSEIVRESNELHPALHVAIHTNASEDHTARGPAVYVDRFDLQNSTRLADSIYRELAAISPAEGFGVMEGYTEFGGKGYYELNRTLAPAVLVEAGFHDNPEDAAFLTEQTDEIGLAIARGILNAGSVSRKAAGETA